MESLKQRVIRAGTWVFGAYMLSNLIRLGSNLIMTRLLAPESFGLMALVLVLMTVLGLFSDIGLVTSIVHSKRGDEPRFLDTAWSIQILRGAALCAVSLTLAGVLVALARTGLLDAASVYADGRLPAIVAVYSVTHIVLGFLPTKYYLAQRHLAMARVTKIEIASQLAGFSAMYAWAQVHADVWALAIGGIAAAMAKLLLCWRSLPGPGNRWAWDGSAARELIHFGKWILVSSTIGVLALHGDRLVLGGMTGPTELGIYAIAYLIASIPQFALSQLARSVALPALSQVQRAGKDLRAAYYRLRLTFDAASLSIAGVLFAAGESVVQLLYDPRYHAAGRLLEILALTAFAMRYIVGDQCFLALGRSDIPARIHGFRLVVLYSLLPIAYSRFGLEGAAWAVALSPMASILPTLYYTKAFGLVDWRRELLLPFLFLPGAAIGWLTALGIDRLRQAFGS